jgi:hypothetical protein
MTDLVISATRNAPWNCDGFKQISRAGGDVHLDEDVYDDAVAFEASPSSSAG